LIITSSAFAVLTTADVANSAAAVVASAALTICD